MGDKTQLFVIGLAAGSKTRDVICGVGVATVLLNAMGVFMGNVLSNLFPMEYIRVAAGFFFLIFAMLTIGQNNAETGRARRSIWGIAISFFIAELGDKTQLSAIAFSASNPNMAMGVFVGATLGMLMADFIGILVAKVLHKQIPEKFMKITAYLIFSFYGFKTLFESFYVFLPGKGTVLTITVAILFAFFSFALLRGKRMMT
ncbi:MAG: TMEM165/GDT1 family protein [Clostridia bacterium]|nr:TMEM165/GDT1 family protein [Clostridia bacterium]